MFFQNPHPVEFQGALLLADRQFNLTFKVPANSNGSYTWMMAFNQEPYNLTGNVTLTFNYSFDGKNYAALAINVSAGAASVAAVTCNEIATALNNNATFQTLYLASVTQDKFGKNWLRVMSTRKGAALLNWKTYISNTSAESILRFNKKAGVAELPTYFSRHTIANVNNYPDSVGLLVELSNPVAGVDVAIVDDAGLDSSVVQLDWQLMHGRSGLFNFQKATVDGSDRVTEIIEAPAGAVAGDFARKIQYSYTGANLHPTNTFEIPWTLTTGDLITPP